MAAAQTTLNVPIRDTSEATALKVRKVLAPTTGHATWYRIFCPAELYLERANVTDAADRGSGYETLVAGTEHVISIRRGEFGLSCANTSTAVEITALRSVGPG